MACKTYQPHRCGECGYIDRISYRAVGKAVCYQLQRVNDRKVAVQVQENQKSCSSFHVAKKSRRVGDM